MNKILGGRIKAIKNVKSLLNLVTHPVILDGKEVFFNDRHWAQISRRLAESGFIKKGESRMAIQIVNKMCKDLRNCNLGASAQIVQALGSLKIKDKVTQKWMLNHLLRGLRDTKYDGLLKQQELFMILCGAMGLFDSTEVKLLIENIEELLIVDNKPTPFFSQMRPNALVTLAVCCTWSHFKDNKLYSKIWERIKNHASDIPVNQFLYFLNSATTKYCAGSKDFLETVHARILTEKISHEDLVYAWTGFSKQGFLPVNLQKEVDELLQNEKTSCWDKISLLQGYALLGHQEKKGVFIDLLESLKSNVETKKIYPADRVKLVFMASFFLTSSDNEVKYIQEIIDSFDLNETSDSDQHALLNTATILGLTTNFINNRDFKTRQSNIQTKVTSNLIEWLGQHPILKDLHLSVEAKIGERSVDILIDGFDRLGWTQAPLIIELDGVGHYRMDSPEISNGKTQCRNKFLTQLGYTLWVLDLRKDPSLIHEEIISKFEKLIANQEKKPTLEVEDSQNSENIRCNNLFAKVALPVGGFALGLWYLNHEFENLME